MKDIPPDLDIAIAILLMWGLFLFKFSFVIGYMSEQ